MDADDIHDDDLSDESEPSLAQCRRAYAGFTISCDHCGSERVMMRGEKTWVHQGPSLLEMDTVVVQCTRCGARVVMSRWGALPSS